MNRNVIIITAKTVSHFKKRAKLRQRETGQAHHEALDAVAIDAKFNNWHHVTLAAKETSDLEKRLKTGVYVLMDVKEGMDSLGDDFEQADEPWIFRWSEIAKWLRDNDDEEEPEQTEQELRELFDENYMCIRYVGKQSPTRANVVQKMQELLYWMPQLIWFKGKCFEPLTDDLELEEDDEVDGPAEPMPSIDEAALRSALGGGTDLVINSPDTMERYQLMSGPRKAWNWCLHCERAYPQGSYRQLRDLQICPYKGCDGDAVMDLWPWVNVRRYNPGYPEIPSLGTTYVLYGPNSQKPGTRRT